MSGLQQQDEICLDKEFVGIPPPHNAHCPTINELLDLCVNEHPRKGIASPSESPVFWVKYGQAVYWNEVVAQDMAYHELRRLGSPVRAPAVFYAFQYDYRVFIVMKYIHGNTVSKRLEESQNHAEKEDIIDQVVLSLTELHRIPIPSGSRPAAVDGGYIRHALFDEQEAPRHYENVEQLELHLNEVGPYFELLC